MKTERSFKPKERKNQPPGCDLRRFLSMGMGICILLFILFVLIAPVNAASLDLSGGTATLYGTYNYDYVNLSAGAILYIAAYNGTAGTGSLNLTVLYDVNIDSTSSINGNGRGYRGGASNTGGEGAGGGAGSTQDSYTSAWGGAGGAGYTIVGGAGGNCRTYSSWGHGGAGGAIYGTVAGTEIYMGSGAGGGGAGATGGAGGAMINITASNMVISGTITMNGSAGGAGAAGGDAGSGGGGGGSGGGIKLTGTTINISNSRIYTLYGLGGAGGGGVSYSGYPGNPGSSGRLKIFHKGIFYNTSTTVISGSEYYVSTNAVPTVPTLTNPLNNSVDYTTTSVNMTWTTSTDADGDVTYYYFVSNNTGFTDLVAFGNTNNTWSGSKTIPANVQLFFRVFASDYIVNISSPVVSIRDLTLSSPANQSISYFNYPPLTSNVLFSWSATNSSVVNYNLVVAKDINFDLGVSDTTFSGTTKTLSLPSGSYFWKVRPYYLSTGLHGTYTPTWNFTLISNVSATGTGIHGVVYELINGVQTPVSNARVIVRNEVLNWTSEQSTGSNGYFLFSNLTNSTTYNLYATRSDVYKDSVVYYVTTGTGTISTQNILLERCYSGFDCFYNQAYVKFTVKNMMFGWTYSGVAISVYEGDGIVAVNTGTTKSDGSVTFLLKKDQEYRITAIKASEGIDGHIHIIPGNSVDQIIPIWSFTENREDSVSWNLSAVDNNATTTWLNLTYMDTSGLTTQINFWVLNGSNTSQIIHSTSTASSSLDVGVSVNDTTKGSFIYGFNATRNGVVITENKAITFTGSTPLIDLKIDNKYYVWISLIFLTCLALLFSKNTNRNGYILIPLIALFLSWLGMFPVSYLITASALVIGVIAYLRSAEKKSEVTY